MVVQGDDCYKENQELMPGNFAEHFICIDNTKMGVMRTRIISPKGIVFSRKGLFGKRRISKENNRG
jgi:hypothetical protein